MVAVAIFIAGTIGSIAVGGQSYSFSFGAFLIPEIGTIITGMVFLGFSEIIQLLQDIKDKLK